MTFEYSPARFFLYKMGSVHSQHFQNNSSQTMDEILDMCVCGLMCMCVIWNVFVDSSLFIYILHEISFSEKKSLDETDAVQKA